MCFFRKKRCQRHNTPPLYKEPIYKTESARAVRRGCYIKTRYTGPHDCLQVRALRRFRDRVLERTLCGRAFLVKGKPRRNTVEAKDKNSGKKGFSEPSLRCFLNIRTALRSFCLRLSFFFGLPDTSEFFLRSLISHPIAVSDEKTFSEGVCR